MVDEQDLQKLLQIDFNKLPMIPGRLEKIANKQGIEDEDFPGGPLKYWVNVMMEAADYKKNEPLDDARMEFEV